MKFARPYSPDEIRRLLINAVLEVLASGGDVREVDAAIDRTAAEMERKIRTHYAEIESALRQAGGERLQ